MVSEDGFTSTFMPWGNVPRGDVPREMVLRNGSEKGFEEWFTSTFVLLPTYYQRVSLYLGTAGENNRKWMDGRYPGGHHMAGEFMGGSFVFVLF